MATVNGFKNIPAGTRVKDIRRHPHDPGNDKCQAQVPSWEILVGRYKNTQVSVVCRTAEQRDSAIAALGADAYALESTTACGKLAVQYISRWEHYLCAEHKTDERYQPRKRKEV